MTVDRGIEHQQNVVQAGFGLDVLIAPSNHIADLRPLAEDVEQALASL